MKQFCELSHCKLCNKLISKYQLSLLRKTGIYYENTKLRIYCGLDCRDKGNTKSWLNKDFFTFSKPEYCYILGWLFADGHISKKNIVLKINKDDANDIKDILFTSGQWNVYHYNKSQINSNWKDITEFNIGGKQNIFNAKKINLHLKSQFISQDILNIIPAKFLHLFLRGMFDGDGCWYYNEENYCRQFSVVGPSDFDWDWLTNIFTQLKITKWENFIHTGNFGSGRYIRLCNQHNIKKLGDYLYKDNLHLKLNRKYDKFLEMTQGLS